MQLADLYLHDFPSIDHVGIRPFPQIKILIVFFHFQCDEMVNICGFKVPIKAQVLVNVWAMGREPTTCWENPEMFMPKRFWQLLGAPSNFAGAPSNMGERAKMSFTL